LQWKLSWAGVECGVTVDEFLASGGVIEKLGDTQRIKKIDLRTMSRASFGNLPPKENLAIPPAPRKQRKHKIRTTGSST
jgi:hypothetical protein